MMPFDARAHELAHGQAPLKKIAGLSAAFVTSNLARAAIGLGLSLAIGRALGAERFGRWILCTTWASTLTVAADLGLGVLLTRDGARDDAPAGRLLAGALTLRLLLAVPLAAILAIAAPQIAAEPESIAGIRFGALLGAMGAVYGCFGSLLRSQPRSVPTLLALETGWLAVQLALASWIVARGGGIVVLVILAAAVQSGQIATAVVLWRRVFGMRGAPALLSIADLRAMVRRSLPFAASGIVANLQTRVAPLMLGHLSTEAQLGLYAAAAKVGAVARSAPQAIFAGALPVLSKEFGRDREDARPVFRAFDRALLILIVLIAAGCLFVATPLVGAAFGKTFAGAAPALALIAIALVPALINSTRKILLYASGGEAAALGWSAVTLAVQIVGGVFLIPAWGARGAALAALISEAAVWLPLRQATSPARVASDPRTSSAPGLSVSQNPAPGL